jgi:hypothetical protein
MGHVLNLACQAFLFTKDKDAVELAIQQAAALQRREESEGDAAGPVLPSESEYSQDEATQESWRKIGPLGKIHNLAVWLRRSPSRYQAFKKQAGRILPRDNDTRWNSWLTMLEVALELQVHIRVFIERHWDDMKKNHLDTEDWDTLAEIKSILLPFRDTTKYLEGDESTLDQVLWTMDILIEHISSKQRQHAHNPDLSASLLTMWFAFDKYYKLTDKTPAYVAALLLNPLYRKSYINEEWKTIEDLNPGICEEAVDSARQLWVRDYKGNGETGEISQALDPDAVANTVYRQKLLKQQRRQARSDEFEPFIMVFAPAHCSQSPLVNICMSRAN